MNILRTLKELFIPRVELHFLSGVTNFIGDLTGANAVRDAANRAAAETEFRPSTINSSSGSVQATKGPNGELVFDSSLSPELAQIQQRLFSTGNRQLASFNSFDREGMAKNITERLRRLAQPKEQRDYNTLENRLFKQGILTSTPGQKNLQTLFDSQQLADVGRQIQGDVQAGAELDRLLSSATGLFSGGTQIGNIDLGLIDRSITAGGGQSSAAASAGQFSFMGAQNTQDMLAGFFQGLLGGIGGYADGGGYGGAASGAANAGTLAGLMG